MCDTPDKIQLVVGLSVVNFPFAGGTLVPSPDIMFPLFTDGLGQDEFQVLWPPSVASGFTFYAQWWVLDPMRPSGYAASNGVMATTP